MIESVMRALPQWPLGAQGFLAELLSEADQERLRAWLQIMRGTEMNVTGALNNTSYVFDALMPERVAIAQRLAEALDQNDKRLLDDVQGMLA